MKNALPLGKPAIPASALGEIRAILASGRLVEGEHCAAFAAALADKAGVPHAVLVNSGTSALYLSLLAMGVGPGDAVIVPAFSFPATANVVAWLGALPVFADIDPGTWNLDADTVSACVAALPASVRERIKAVMPVQAFGNPVAIGPLLKLANARGWRIVEDAACAIGSELGGRACGTHGMAGCLSFHPRKILTTSEGGAILTRDRALARRLNLLKNHGMVRAPGGMRFPGLGLNLRFTEIAAALGMAQLRRLDALLAERARQAARYREGLEAAGFRLQDIVPGGKANWQSLVARLPGLSARRRDGLLQGLARRGIQATIGTYYLPGLPAFRRLAAVRPCPEAQAVFAETVSLPLFPGLKPRDIERVVGALRALA